MRAKHCYFMITPSLSLAVVLLWWKWIPLPHLNKKKSIKEKQLYLTPWVINISAWQNDLCRFITEMVISSFVLPVADGCHMSEAWCRSHSGGRGELIKEKSFWVPLLRLTLAKTRATFSEPAP